MKRELKTLKGSKIRRSTKAGVGKEMGGCIYFHRDYIYKVSKAMSTKQAVWFSHCRRAIVDTEIADRFNVVKFEWLTGKTTFFACDDFDDVHEPSVGWFVTVWPTGRTRESNSPMLWHHKWLFVDDDYTRFDVEEAYQRSAKWLALPEIEMSRIGQAAYWNEIKKEIR